MVTPNLYVLADPSGNYGLHKFKDGCLMILKQHKCGDWQTVRPPRTSEVEHFERYGEKVKK